MNIDIWCVKYISSGISFFKIIDKQPINRCNMISSSSPPSSQIKDPLPQRYKYQSETRTAKQIQLSNSLCYALSDLNMKRVNNKAESGDHVNAQQMRALFYFICLCGLPPFQGQFENLDLPGDKTVLYVDGFKGDYSEDQYMELFKAGGFQHQVNKIRKIVEQKSKTHKIIMMYHSFGTFVFVNYFRTYPDHKLTGIIDAGGAPLRFYPILLGILSGAYAASQKDLIQNRDQIHQAYISNSIYKKTGINTFSNKYHTMIFLKFAISPSYQDMFQNMRKMPKVLKLFLYGRKDKAFTDTQMNQKSVHYSYVDKLDQQYQQKLKKAYKKYYGTECKNVQERFVFNFQEGQHSIHMQGRYRNDVKNAITQYLQVLLMSMQ